MTRVENYVNVQTNKQVTRVENVKSFVHGILNHKILFSFLHVIFKTKKVYDNVKATDKDVLFENHFLDVAKSLKEKPKKLEKLVWNCLNPPIHLA